MKRFLLQIWILIIPHFLIAQEYNSEIIEHSTRIVFNGNRLIKEITCEIKINNRAGERFTRISIPSSKTYKTSNIKAYIKDSKNRIVKKLKKGDIVERSSISDISFYADDFVKEFTLKHNRYPYTLNYSYRVQQNQYMYIDYWSPVLNEDIPTHNAYLELYMPVQQNITYSSRLINEPVIDSGQNGIIYKWNANYLNIIKEEKYSPALTDLMPHVIIVPENFNFEIEGSFKNWESYGYWQYRLISELNELPEIEIQRINALVSGIDDNKEKIRRLYHYLQDETRYINITIETGGLKPYPASYVTFNKYGDCKALTNYLKSILDYLRIKSYYSNVYAGSPGVKINTEFPSQQFNHVILYIPLKEEDIWLDCTSNLAFNYLGTFTQDRDVFIIDSFNSRFLKSPALTPADVVEIRKIEISGDIHRANVRFNNVFKGEMYETIVQLDNNYNVSEKLKIIENYFIEDGFELSNYKIVKKHRDSASVEFNFEATTQKIYKQYGNEIILGNISLAIPHFEKPENRNLPVQFDYPIYKIDTLIYDFVPGYGSIEASSNVNISNKFGKFKIEVKEKGGNIVIVKTLLINSGYYPISDYEEFYKFYENVIEANNKHIVIYK